MGLRSYQWCYPATLSRWRSEDLLSYLVLFNFWPVTSSTTKIIWSVSNISDSSLLRKIFVNTFRISSRCCFVLDLHYVECAVPSQCFRHHNSCIETPLQILRTYQKYGPLHRVIEFWKTWAVSFHKRFFWDPTSWCISQPNSEPDGTNTTDPVSYGINEAPNAVALYQPCEL